ncbi:MAG: class I SAM-dependent methyltransferase, partial [bacterium]
MHEPLRLTLTACQPIEGKTVLNLCCGVGTFSFPLAELGAEQVVGVDASEDLVQKARSAAEQRGLERRCLFECADVLFYQSPQSYDYVVALGLLDQ